MASLLIVHRLLTQNQLIFGVYIVDNLFCLVFFLCFGGLFFVSQCFVCSFLSHSHLLQICLSIMASNFVYMFFCGCECLSIFMFLFLFIYSLIQYIPIIFSLPSTSPSSSPKLALSPRSTPPLFHFKREQAP